MESGDSPSMLGAWEQSGSTFYVKIRKLGNSSLLQDSLYCIVNGGILEGNNSALIPPFTLFPLGWDRSTIIHHLLG